MSKVHELVLWPSPGLLKECGDETGFDAMTELNADILITSVYAHQGFGLAANQVGIDKKMFVVMLGNDKELEKKTPTVFVNPSYVSREGGTIVSVEGCLSFPGVRANIKERHAVVTIQAFDVDGAPFQNDYSGMDSVIIQHEMDHIYGKCILDRMGPLQKRLAKERLSKRLKKHEHGT